MTPKERAVMQQALKALENNLPINYVENGLGEKFPCFSNDPLRESNTRAAIIALREALADSVVKESLTGGEQWSPDDMAYRPSGLSMEQAEQEPVAFVSEVYQSRHTLEWNGRSLPVGTLLYAAPIRTKDLTEDEIFQFQKEIQYADVDPITFARAVIAADREKNK